MAWSLTALESRGFNRAEPTGASDPSSAPAASHAASRAAAPMRPFRRSSTPLPYVALNLSDKINMANGPMREPLACPPALRTHGRVEVERTDEVTSQRSLALAALKAPQNIPQHDWYGQADTIRLYVVLAVEASPDEDPMSLQYVKCLTVPARGRWRGDRPL